jgi:hypothetical protein
MRRSGRFRGFTGGKWPGDQLNVLECHFAANRELMTALGAAAAQNLAAIFGSHARAKTVFVYTLAVARLKCTLHKVFPS